VTPLSPEGAALVAEVMAEPPASGPLGYAALSGEQRDEIERLVLDVLASGAKPSRGGAPGRGEGAPLARVGPGDRARGGGDAGARSDRGGAGLVAHSAEEDVMAGHGKMVTAGKVPQAQDVGGRGFGRVRNRRRQRLHEQLQAASKSARETGPMHGRTRLPRALARAWERFRAAGVTLPRILGGLPS